MEIKACDILQILTLQKSLFLFLSLKTDRGSAIKHHSVLANLGCLPHTPGKRETQLRNCLYQIGLCARLRDTVLTVSGALGRWAWAVEKRQIIVSQGASQ